MGLAFIKFSGSINMKGNIVLSKISPNKTKITVIKSLIIKNLLNLILSKFNGMPRGLDEPVSWSIIKWIPLIAIIIKGMIKWKDRKRVKVGSPTLNPPHSHCTARGPKYGITEIRLVITVAPQKDIWPQGRT